VCLSVLLGISKVNVLLFKNIFFKFLILHTVHTYMNLTMALLG
jgi:hypothetical protein